MMDRTVELTFKNTWADWYMGSRGRRAPWASRAQILHLRKGRTATATPMRHSPQLLCSWLPMAMEHVRV